MGQPTHRVVYYFEETTRLYLKDGRILFNDVTPNNALDEKPTQVKPKEENGVWIETATTEEIENHNRPEVVLNRQLLLKQGIVVTSNGVNYWFNESFLNNFITMAQITKEAGGVTINWEADDKNWYTIPLAEAFQIGAMGAQMIQAIYENN